jgi:protein ImuA
MLLISAHNHQLQKRILCEERERGFLTGVAELDQLLPASGLQRGAVHEVLHDTGDAALFFAMLIARAASNEKGAVVCADPHGELYPPAINPLLSLSRLFMLHVRDPRNELWAICECLRCKGVAATIATPKPLTRIEARRLQLAAEHGGGIGVLIRETKTSTHYAAATRWLVKPIRGDESVQRWNIKLIHGHGGQVGKSVVLEVPRDRFDPNYVRAIDPVADRPDQTQTTKVSA